MTEIRRCEHHGPFEGERCPTCETTGTPLLSSDRRTQVSKFISGALRHFPDDAGLDLDAAGWTDLQTLVDRTQDTYDWLPEGAVEAIVHTDPKGRFERDGDRIRAAYGHSVDIDLDPDSDSDPDADDTAVPNVLYHGTAPDALAAIREEGLKPMSRQHVHLSGSVEAAREVGSRHAADPVVLHVDAEAMTDDGKEITKRGRAVYTTDHVSPRYLSQRD